jgi:hypothetical protein
MGELFAVLALWSNWWGDPREITEANHPDTDLAEVTRLALAHASERGGPRPDPIRFPSAM